MIAAVRRQAWPPGSAKANGRDTSSGLDVHTIDFSGISTRPATGTG
jgi:hypothetical protein